MRRRRGPWVAAFRVTLLVLALAFAGAAFSYGRAMMEPSSLPLSMRTIEWIRDNGGAGLVNLAEKVYYSATAPSPGGPNLDAVPAIGATAELAAGPAPVVGAVTPMLKNEGVWRGTGRSVLGGEPVLVTTFRPEAAYPRQLAYAAWIDTSRVKIALYAGRKQPPDANPRGPMEVPTALRSGLLAAFNSGFTYKDSKGGWAADGQTMEPMVGGQGTLIGYTNGRVDIVSWSGGAAVTPDVAFARQNLPLLVDGGQPAANLADDAAWGQTLGNAVRVWRSGIGIDATGNLVYVAAPGQTAESLAGALMRLGAVRAMQLDINAFWPTFNAYSQPNAGGATMIVPNPSHTAQRYLTPDDRDFFAVYAATSRRAPLPK